MAEGGRIGRGDRSGRARNGSGLGSGNPDGVRAGHGLDGSRLPVMIRHDGRTMLAPTPAEITLALEAQ